MNKKDRGFIGLIILIILALAALKYFLNWDIFDAAESEEGKNTIDYIRNVLNTVWRYIGAPLSWIWDEIVWPLLSLLWDTVRSLIATRNNAN